MFDYKFDQLVDECNKQHADAVNGYTCYNCNQTISTSVYWTFKGLPEIKCCSLKCYEDVENRNHKEGKK